MYGFDREPLSVYDISQSAAASPESSMIKSNSPLMAQGYWAPAVSLTAARTTIRRGESTVLTCDVINATYSELSEYGPLGYSDDELIEYVTVSPYSTTTYVLTAYNDAGSSTAEVTVTVDVGPPPPPTTTGHNLIYGFGQLISESLPTGAIYIQGDQVGSPNLITNSGGVLINRTKNLPFGERLVDGIPGVPRSLRRYTNHEEDPDSNAIYMQARTYLAAYGKFAQVDPAYDQTKDDPESWNLYNYVTNNPVTKTDPDGRIAALPIEDIGHSSSFSYMNVDGMLWAFSASEYQNLWYGIERRTLFEFSESKSDDATGKGLEKQTPSAQTLPGGVPLPSDVPPQPGTHSGGVVWDPNTFSAYVNKALMNGYLSAEMTAAGSAIAGITEGGLTNGAAGQYDPISKMITIDTTRLTLGSQYFGEFVETLAHEIRHGWQEAMVSQGFLFGHVQLGVSRDASNGAITYQTFSRSTFREMGESESQMINQGNIRGYLMLPQEIDARIFAEWMRRDVKW